MNSSMPEGDAKSEDTPITAQPQANPADALVSDKDLDEVSGGLRAQD